jgi:putative transposase
MGETPRLQAKPLGGLRYDGEMAEYRKGSHSIYTLHYHFVFIPKYRKPVLRGDVGLRVRELVRRICHSLDVEIIKGM